MYMCYRLRNTKKSYLKIFIAIQLSWMSNINVGRSLITIVFFFYWEKGQVIQARAVIHFIPQIYYFIKIMNHWKYSSNSCKILIKIHNGSLGPVYCSTANFGRSFKADKGISPSQNPLEPRLSTFCAQKNSFALRRKQFHEEQEDQKDIGSLNYISV